MDLTIRNKVVVKQVFEAFELMGFETRNKYAIFDEGKKTIGFAAEQRTGILGHLLRQILGHWRKFDVHFFDENRTKFMHAHHPFRFYFQRLEISDADGKKIGTLEQRFSIINKKFDVLDDRDNVILEMRSPLLKFWTFPFYRKGLEIAKVTKKWSGLLAEAFTDKDTFLIDFGTGELSETEKKIILATSIYIDLQYFEKKAR